MVINKKKAQMKVRQAANSIKRGKMKKKVRVKKKVKKISRLRKPEEMGLEQWQITLRKQFGREQTFRLKNIGAAPFFSEFLVTNPQTESQYRVAIRGTRPGENYCSCRDYAVNTLGTCKHIEFVLSRLEKKRGGKKAFREGHTAAYSEVYLRYGVKREVIFASGVNCTEKLRTLARRYFNKEGILTLEGYRRFSTFLKAARKIEPELRCYEDTLTFIAEVRDHDKLKKQIAKVFPGGIRSAGFRQLLKTSLYPYQRKGALFAAQAGRSLIADDMGLGKTVQAIAATEILARVVNMERVLIVSPTSLKHQWKQEIEKFTKRSVDVVEGSGLKRANQYSADGTFYKITNYDVIHRDMEWIRSWSPDLIILDEAQRIKNWQTRTAQSVKNLESKYALVLTGTPLENRLEELHSIVEFVDRFHLGPRFRFLTDHQQVDEDGMVVGYRNLSGIARTLEPILIRRTKREVLKELPERVEKNFFVPMTKEQQRYHEENRETVARIVAKWRRYGYLSDTDQRILMSALQNMRMSCNSTYLLDKKTDYGVKADELLTVLGEIFEESQAKVVVFSQWLGTHKLISDRLESNKWDYILFHGGVPGRKRKDLISRFKRDPRCRVFLSTDAGGVGLNLQNAAAVINMDLPWNPAVLNQRIGRVHRLGQRRSVRVVNFIAQGTIEHGMLSLLSFKQALFAGVLEKGQDEVFLGGTRLKRFMDSVEKATTNIPESMPTKEEEARQQREAAQEVLSKSGVKTAGKKGAGTSWESLISTGLSLLSKLGENLSEKGQHPKQTIAKAISSISVETDQATGQSRLQFPIPKKETLHTIANLIHEFAQKI